MRMPRLPQRAECDRQAQSRSLCISRLALHPYYLFSANQLLVVLLAFSLPSKGAELLWILWDTAKWFTPYFWVFMWAESTRLTGVLRDMPEGVLIVYLHLVSWLSVVALDLCFRALWLAFVGRTGTKKGVD